MAGIITGENGYFYISAQEGGMGGNKHSDLSTSEFTMTFSRDVVEQSLLGEQGNMFMYGPLSVDGSFTQCKFAASGDAEALVGIVESKKVFISGGTESGGLTFAFKSCNITGYDFDMNDAGDITEANISWSLQDPADVTYTAGLIKNY